MLQVIEQARFCLHVPFHRAVIVEMVTRKVGEHCDIELESVDPPLIETMRGNLHRNRAHAAIRQLSQGSLQLDRSRSGKPSAAWQSFTFAADQRSERSDGRTRPIAVVEEMTHD